MLESQSHANDSFPSENDQKLKTEEFLKHIDTHNYCMNRSFDEGDKKKALDEAKLMLEPMKTKDLYPTMYYELYQIILGNLSRLSTLFCDRDFFSDREIAELYEVIQYTSGIIERLYLLFSLAPAFIERGHAKVIEVLDDLSVMVRGVQDPTRGLFIRHFLVHILKGKLPLGDSEDGTLEDTIRFIQDNFRQKNVLWVRLEFRLGNKIESVKKKQRSELKQLIGFSLQRISQLQGLELDHYVLIVMPFLIKQIVECREPMAQDYLLEVMIQVFPTEYHLETLDKLFETLLRVEKDVKVMGIVSLLISRVQQYFSIGNSCDINVLKDLCDHVYEFIMSDVELGYVDFIGTMESLLKLCSSVDKDNLELVNALFEIVYRYNSDKLNRETTDSDDESRGLMKFLLVPLKSLSSISDIFKFQRLGYLIRLLRNKEKISFTTTVCESFVDSGLCISNEEELKSIFNICSFLLPKKNDNKAPDIPSASLVAFSKLFHLVKGQDPTETQNMLTDIFDTIQYLAINVREKLCLPLGQAFLQLVHQVDSTDSKLSILEAFCENVNGSLQDEQIQENLNGIKLAVFYLYLDAASISDKYLDESYTKAFITNAFKLFISGMGLGSSKKFILLCSIIKHVGSLENVSMELYNLILDEIRGCIPTYILGDDCVEGYLLCASLCKFRDSENPENLEKSTSYVKSCLAQALDYVRRTFDKKKRFITYHVILSHAVYFFSKGVVFRDGYFTEYMELIEENAVELDSLSENESGMIKSIINYKNSVIGS